jgi:hypothetical protein
MHIKSVTFTVKNLKGENFGYAVGVQKRWYTLSQFKPRNYVQKIAKGIRDR